MPKKKPATPPGRRTITFTPDDEARIAFLIAKIADRAGVGTNAAEVVRLAVREFSTKRGYEETGLRGGAR